MDQREEKRRQDLQLLDRYMSTVSPLGDWRNPVLYTPIMTKLVQNMYDAKASQPNKLSYYNDIIDSFNNVGKHQAMASSKLAALSPNGVDVVRTLVNDTINTRVNTTLSFLNENLRREFVQSEYMVTGSTLNGQASERELYGSGITQDGITQILSNLTSLDQYAEAVDNMVKKVLPKIIPMAEILKQNNPEMFEIFRILLASAEGLGTVLSVLKGLHDGAVAIHQPSMNAVVNSGVAVATDVVAPINTNRSFADAFNDMKNIAAAMAPLGNHVPNRILEVLQMSSNESDINDLVNILNNNAIPLTNHNKVALAVSTAYACQTQNSALATAPNNIALAALYISKLYADKKSGSDAQTDLIARGFSEISGTQFVSMAGYRLGLKEAIIFDMNAGNNFATNALGHLVQSPEIQTFSRMMLSREVTGSPQLTKQALMTHLKSATAYNSTPTAVDVDEFMKSRHYSGNVAVPAARQEIITAILEAIKYVK